jgi:hypothetical protein
MFKNVLDETYEAGLPVVGTKHRGDVGQLRSDALGQLVTGLGGCDDQLGAALVDAAESVSLDVDEVVLVHLMSDAMNNFGFGAGDCDSHSMVSPFR